MILSCIKISSLPIFPWAYHWAIRAEVPVPQGERSIAFSPQKTAFLAVDSGLVGFPVQRKWIHLFIRESSGCTNSYCSLIFIRSSRLKAPKSPAVNLSIPTETQSGKVFRLRGKGVKSYRDRTTGDLFCSIQIETPVNLNNEQKNILKSFEESINSSKKEHRPNKNKWSESVKSFFNRLGI